MPFTADRQLESSPRLLAARRGAIIWTADGREIMDGVSGLWCVNAGHGRREITEAVTEQLGTMEFAAGLPDGSPDRLRIRESLE